MRELNHKQQLVILHLSDLHIKAGEEDGQNEVLDSLNKRVKKAMNTNIGWIV